MDQFFLLRWGQRLPRPSTAWVGYPCRGTQWPLYPADRVLHGGENTLTYLITISSRWPKPAGLSLSIIMLRLNRAPAPSHARYAPARIERKAQNIRRSQSACVTAVATAEPGPACKHLLGLVDTSWQGLMDLVTPQERRMRPCLSLLWMKSSHAWTNNASTM